MAISVFFSKQAEPTEINAEIPCLGVYILFAVFYRT